MATKAQKIEDKALSIKSAINNHIKGAVLSSATDYDFPVVVVKKDKLHDTISFLRDDKEMDYNFLTTLCCVHYPHNTGKEFCMMYQMHNLQKNSRLRIKCFTAEKDTVFPTITDLFATANWMEREAYDFFGMQFEGHPNLKRILNVDYMESFPMRKEFPLEDPTREDKEDEMFGR